MGGLFDVQQAREVHGASIARQLRALSGRYEALVPGKEEFAHLASILGRQRVLNTVFPE